MKGRFLSLIYCLLVCALYTNVKGADITALPEMIEIAWPLIQIMYKGACTYYPQLHLCPHSSDPVAPPSVPYDVIIDLCSVKALSNTSTAEEQCDDRNGVGWPVHIVNQNAFHKLQSDAKGVFIGLVGLFNTGKTWLVTQLTGIPLPSGNTVHTVGLSILAHNNMFFVDSQGLQSPGVKMGGLFDKKCTDSLIQQATFELSHKKIIVVNRITLYDQMYLNTTMERLGSGDIILVHNKKDISSVSEIQEAISADVENIFGATKYKIKIHLNGKEIEAVFWQSSHLIQETQKEITIHHFVFAREGTPAGLLFNKQSVQLLLDHLKTGLVFDTFRPLQKVMNTISAYLPHYFVKEGAIFTTTNTRSNWFHWNPFWNSEQKVAQEGNSEKNQFELYFDSEEGKSRIKLATPRELKYQTHLDFREFNVMDFRTNPSGNYTPEYSVTSNDDAYYIEVELPGISKDHIRLQYYNKRRYLVIEGEKKPTTSKSKNSQTYSSKNKKSGSFRLVIEFDGAVDKFKEDFDHGILKIYVPRLQ